MGFPLAFEIIRTVLGQHLNVKCVTDVPASRPQRFVSIDGSATVGASHSGVKARVLGRRRLIIYCWGTSEVDAAEMAEDARDILLRLPEMRLGARRVDIVGEPARRDYIVGEQKVHDRHVFTVDVLLRANP